VGAVRFALALVAGGWWLVEMLSLLDGRRIRDIFVFGDAFFQKIAERTQRKALGAACIPTP